MFIPNLRGVDVSLFWVSMLVTCGPQNVVDANILWLSKLIFLKLVPRPLKLTTNISICFKNSLFLIFWNFIICTSITIIGLSSKPLSQRRIIEKLVWSESTGRSVEVIWSVKRVCRIGSENRSNLVRSKISGISDERSWVGNPDWSSDRLSERIERGLWIISSVNGSCWIAVESWIEILVFVGYCRVNWKCLADWIESTADWWKWIWVGNWNRFFGVKLKEGCLYYLYNYSKVFKSE